DEFFGSISHELRTPLTSIKAYAQLLHRRLQRVGAVDAETDDALTSIVASASRMNELIDGLLDLSRIQTGRPLDFDRRSVNLVALLHETARPYRSASPEHRVQVETSCTDLTGTYDPARLGWVISNLISNAIKYSPQGGTVQVTLAAEGADDEGGWAVL